MAFLWQHMNNNFKTIDWLIDFELNLNYYNTLYFHNVTSSRAEDTGKNLSCVI